MTHWLLSFVCFEGKHIILNDDKEEDGDKDDDEDDDYAMDANWHISRQVLPQATSAFPVTALLPHTTAYPSQYFTQNYPWVLPVPEFH